MRGRNPWTRKLGALVMALALCVGLLPVSALAADIEDWEDITLPQTSGEWTSEGNYDVSWYNTKDTSFTLSNAADLAGLAVIVNGLNGQDRDFFSGKTVTLATNGTFDLSGKTWTPITGFAGTFDGNNATISGMVIESAFSSGLFSEIRSGATVKDLKIEDAYIVVQMPGYEVYPTTSVGGLAGTNAGGTIQSCTFSGTIITNAYNIGGIAGRCTGTNSKVETCVNNGTLISKRESTSTVYGVGGIVGLLHTGTVSNCTNNGTVTGYIGNPVGGVVGEMWDGTVSSCRNTAAVQGQGYSASGIGGIVGDISVSGSSNSVAITDCHNSGNVTLSAGTQRQIGGIVGQTSGASIEISQCSNTGKISSTQSGNSLKLGGLVGSTGGVLTLTQSYNVGSVDIPSSTGYAGGLIGEATRPTSLQVENCYNVGAVTGGTVGGLIGRLYATDSSGRTVSISSSYNTGSVNNGTGNAMVGQTSTYVTLTVADSCTYLDTSGTGGLGRSQTANQMTDDTDWITNLGLNSSTWEKENNPTTVDSDGNWMGNLPVLTANEQDPAPQIQRTQKQDQPGFAITDEPTPTDTIYIDSTGFQLGTTGGAEGLSVTWSSSDDKVATVDSNGKVTIKGVGEVTITAQKAGNDSYNEASDAYTFTVYGRPITEVTILNLAAPVQGESPRQNVSVPEDDPYEGLTSAGIGGPSTLQVTWREQGSDSVITTTFEQNKVYTVTMALKCDDYYSFDDSVTVYLSNMLESAYQKITAEKDTVNGHENYLIITVTFNPTSHVHNWATAWSSNATHHWHACTDADCPLKNPEGVPSYSQHDDANSDDICDICQATIGYLITFDPNGGTCDTASVHTDIEGKLTTLPTPSRSGYTFLGWYLEDGTQANEDTVFNQNATLTAQWRYSTPPTNPNYKITVDDTQGGTVVVTPTSAKAGTTVTLTPVPDQGFALDTLAVTDRFGNPVSLTEGANGTYTFVMPDGQVTVTATFTETAPEPLPFTDVTEGDWFYDAVRYAYENGLMDGVEDNRFAPNSATTRAQLVTILYRLEGQPTVSGNLPFTDVETGIWYTDAILWAAQNNIVNGVSDTEFAPGDDLTRQQLVTILYRYAEAKGYDVSASADLSGYPDADQVQDYAQPAMAWAVAEGIVEGMDGNLNPAGNASRAQIATILMRFCEDAAQ